MDFFPDKLLRETTPSSMAASRFKYNNCVRGNSLSGYVIDFWCTRSLVRILPGPYISAMHLLICFFVKDFVYKKIQSCNEQCEIYGFLKVQLNRGKEAQD